MKQRHEIEIPHGKIIVKDEQEKNLKGPFAGLNVDVKTTRLLDMAARLRNEAIKTYYVKQREET
jgi:hypothetical protein